MKDGLSMQTTPDWLTGAINDVFTAPAERLLAVVGIKTQPVLIEAPTGIRGLQ